MTDYGAPGVYVQEVPSGPRPITGVGEAVAGFLGVAPDHNALVMEAVPIDNWTQFVNNYVGDARAGTDLSSAVYGFFANQGTRCYVVNLGDDGSLEGTAHQTGGLQLLEAIDEVAIVAAPGYHDLASYVALQAHCEAPTQQDRVAILDPPPAPRDSKGEVDKQAVRDQIERLVVVASEPPAPDPAPSPPAPKPPTAAEDSGSGGGTHGRGTAAAAAGTKAGGLRPPQSDGGYSTFYFPWLRMRCPISGDIISAPPSGHMAGIWARSDATRGVHKAPANEQVLNVLDVEYPVSRTEQEYLNPGRVNCIRSFPASGLRVWGARTLADPASEWRYINVRRLTNMLKESIQDGTQWVVFEPNSYQLWAEIRRDVGAFLTRVWEDGALVGASADEAFFVKCDAETNPPEVRDVGQLVTEIGIAPVKPAEFVVFKLMQSTLTGSATAVGG
ncbi:MAG: phage tail sheath family protein [Microlunatus sp.]|nr:phage tail sheath family protein [Microlunatus sp.]